MKTQPIDHEPSLMRPTLLEVGETQSLFSPFFIDYITQKKTLAPFYNRPPTLSSFRAQIEEKQQHFPKAMRATLHRSLCEQYKDLTLHDAVDHNLQALTDPKTFTVTTGHQLNVFTGPLYTIYKLVSTINLCKQLKKQYPEYRFVPLYWMASEDHDFQEINHFNAHGKTYTWNTDQRGRVGGFALKGMRKWLDTIPGNTEPFRTAYLTQATLSAAVRHYINELFGAEGLIVLDADCHILKKELRAVMMDDLVNHTAQECVEPHNQQLEKLGYTRQIHVRPINLFYVHEHIRERIEHEEDHFVVHDTDLTFTESQLREMVDQTPEKFSPNVSLRPLYQEMILPNLAYIGGPAEIAYWLQLKPLFDHYHTPFPILIPRNSALILDAPTARTWAKTALPLSDVFKTNAQLHTQWAHKHAPHPLDLGAEQQAATALLQRVEQAATRVDTTLQRMVQAELQKTRRSLNKIEHRMLRAEKRKHQQVLQHIDHVKNTLFPKGVLQERVDNFLTFHQADPTFLQQLLQRFDPLDFRVQLLCYPFS